MGIIDWLCNNGIEIATKKEDNGDWERHVRVLGSEFHRYHTEDQPRQRVQLESNNKNRIIDVTPRKRLTKDKEALIEWHN
jgi:hypothetical protein